MNDFAPIARCPQILSPWLRTDRIFAIAGATLSIGEDAQATFEVAY